MKTGTSQAYHDNWTIGYTRDVTVGVWVGNFDRTPARLERAKAALDRATALAPDSPEVFHAAGFYYYHGFRDYARAEEHRRGQKRK